MEFFKHNTTINFMAQRWWTAILSITLAVMSFIVLAVNGLNWGLDFTGGTQLQLRYQTTVDLNMVRTQLEQANFLDVVITYYGTPKEILVSLAPAQTTETIQALASRVLNALPGATLEEANYIG